MLQFKLYKVFNEGKKETLQKLYDIFGRENIIVFSENIIGISYNYDDMGYKFVLKKVMGLNISQIIVTSDIYFKLIDYCVKDNIFIKRINFVDSIEEEHIEFVKDYVEEINRLDDLTEKNSLKDTLFNELSWITSDECIDIKLISLSIKSTESPIRSGIELYHNGVLLIDNENKAIMNKVKLIIRKTMKR